MSKFYSRKVLDLFLNPPHTGVIEGADGTGSAINPACSDQATITIRVADGKIADARFQTQGCAAAIAAGAATMLLIRNLTVEAAEALTDEEVVAYLDGLPEAKIGCSVIAPEALRKAIADWRSRS
jgi:NifU-like protein involved in Fe-S cluster formation